MLGKYSLVIWKLIVMLWFLSRICHTMLKGHNLTTQQPFHQLSRRKQLLPSAVLHNTGKYQLKIRTEHVVGIHVLWQ